MRALLAADFERFRDELPGDFPDHVREAYKIDLTARYLGKTLPHPIGKGSGQLSLNERQLEEDAAAGLAFVVLKTLIAQDAAGVRSMAAWAVHETKMKVERRVVGGVDRGWTVTWKGRGWDRSLEDYLALVRAGRDLTRAGALLVLPSVKYHLPRLGVPFVESEYRFTTAALADAWGEAPLLLEKDFSPTLAGDALAEDQAQILRWLRETPQLIRRVSPIETRVSVKLMNARFEDDFQHEMMLAAADGDALVCFNRLFDVERGVAYGGTDLLERNLRILRGFSRLGGAPDQPSFPALCGTGGIGSGHDVLAYAQAGCEAVQLHTFFQLPLDEYSARSGSRTQRALHQLVFHPQSGLIAGLWRLEQQGAIHRRGGELHFLDLPHARLKG
ncbi:MAG TPA: hypothetical protein VLB49_14360 [Gemmatimonadales bacterium]|nr:hypothetical protein [Gemmatimonadales bacterium]